MNFFVREWTRAIHEAEAEISLRERLIGAPDAFLFNFTGGLSQARGIDDLHGIALQGERFLNGIARCSGVGGDNGSVASSQAIKERGFSDVGGSGNDDASAFAQDTALIPCLEEGADVGGDRRKTLN